MTGEAPPRPRGPAILTQPLERVEPGAVLGRTIYEPGGHPLLVAGTELTTAYLEALRRRGTSAVCVHDGLADDLAPASLVGEQVRSTITGHVATVFSEVAMIAGERGLGTGGVRGATAALGEAPLDLRGRSGELVAELYGDVEALITELLENDTVAGLESLKSHNAYTFEHSVDVAVIGILLARSLGMPRRRLREVALGCLLHDIGKVYVDRAILDKPGRLTAAEFAAITEHPRMGYELVRRLPVASLLPAHVAYQHHERQDGGGYPRGLVAGGPSRPRIDHERLGSGRMLLIAEIGATADVYSALSSDRPYRAAMPPDRVVAMIAELAGSQLNDEVVGHLLRMVPSYPVGHWVEVTKGRYRGWRGVVSDLPRLDVHRPTVRLVLDAGGEAVADPVELDTRREPDGALRCLAAGEAPHRDRVRGSTDAALAPAVREPASARPARR